jgi:serine/threonine protein kinase/Flp pilus assembly protein TadD
MDDARLQRRARSLFDAALELPIEQRHEWLCMVCEREPALLAEVEAYLAADAAAGDFLRGAEEPEESLPAAAAAREEAEAPARIGPYRLVARIGKGGTGRVYLGERIGRGGAGAAPVAIKLLSPERVSRTRFRREAEIQADLRHPGIARLLESGITSEGRPFLVMDLVKGTPMTIYCDEHRLRLRERLQLFLLVCDAVAYAHRSLVLHLDLKPANILVGANGQPTLLDFGFARPLAPDAGADSSSAPRFGTVPYASPEYLTNGGITTAADVYSLGVILHELLTGRRPFDWSNRSLFEILTELERRPPPPPSQAIGRREGSHGAYGVLWSRRSSLSTLRRQLAGDLDSIVLKALRFEPEHRYATVSELQEDLRRHLAGLPVRAHRSTWTYRTGRLVRRHSLAAANVLLIAGLLVTLAVGSTLQARRLARERDAAAQAGARADSVAEFLIEILGATDPRADVQLDVTAQEILRRGGERVGELRAQPDLRAELSHTIGVLSANRGMYEQAERLLNEALALRQEHDLGSRGVADTLAALAGLTAELGHPEEGLDHAARALALRRQALPSGHPDIMASLRQLGKLTGEAGRHGEALEYLREVTELHRRSGSDEELAADLLALSQVMYFAGDLKEAEATIRECIDLLTRINAPAADRASALNTLGATLWKGWRLVEAQAPYRQALELYRAAYGDEHARTAVAYNNLANLLIWLGDGAEASTLMERAVAINRAAYGESHPTVGINLSNLANMMRSSGRLAEAEQIHRDVLASVREQLGSEHPRTIVALYSLGSTLLLTRRYEEAEGYLVEALERGAGVLGADHGDQLTTLVTIARLRHRQGRFADAAEHYREFLAIMGSTEAGEASPGMANGRYGLAEVLVDAGRAREALEPARQAVRTMQASIPAEHHMRLEAEGVLGYVLAHLGRRDEARGLLMRSYERLLASQGNDSDRTVAARRWLSALDEKPR